MTCRNYQVSHGLIARDRLVPTSDELIILSPQEICHVLCYFIVEVKNVDGKDYTRDTLYDLVVMVQAFLKKNRRPIKLFEDVEFTDVCNTLDNKMKQLVKEGKVAPREKAQPISVSDEDAMWNKGILGDDTPEKLVNTLLYLNGVHFGLRAAEQHKSLHINCQFKVGYDDAVGLKFLQ